MHQKNLLPATFVAAILLCTSAAGRPVIPGASGYGIDTPAGRGGKIMRVTNLNAGGEGSLQACISQTGPRICVFEVSGTINITSNLKVENPYLTIAGQTAPSPGIMIRGAALQIMASDVLVQHIAVRAGDSREGPVYDARDALKIISNDPISNIVIDHCSFSWGIDENIEAWNKWGDLTISNTIISEPLRDSFHSKGLHGLGVLLGTTRTNTRSSFIGNLIAHSHGRNPRSNATEFVMANNVIYNAKGAETMLFNDSGLLSHNTIVGNVFIKGPDASDAVKPIRLTGSTQWGTELLAGSKLYVADNIARSATGDPWSIVDNQTSLSRAVLEASELLSWPADLKALPAEEVLGHVLRNAGTRPDQRNRVDAGIVADVRNGTGRIINCVSDNGTARCTKNAGGWPTLAQNTRRLTVPGDPHADDDGDGYTNVEEWLHAMAAEVEGRAVAANPEPTEPDRPPPKAPRLMGEPQG